MAFKLENFGSEVANIKNIFGGICFYTYHLPTGDDTDDAKTAGYFPTNLGLKDGDRIDIIDSQPAGAAVLRYIVNIVDGVISLTAEADI